jgi:SAM-dependent methyltransferase
VTSERSYARTGVLGKLPQLRRSRIAYSCEAAKECGPEPALSLSKGRKPWVGREKRAESRRDERPAARIQSALSTIDIVIPEHFDDPVAAYDRLAAHYAELNRRRELYLHGVEREIVSRIPKGSGSLLDVGAGDGSRALRIASELAIKRIVLAEPSQEMAGRSKEQAEVWPVRAEDLGPDAAGETRRACGPGTAEDVRPPTTLSNTITKRFDVITCLWNVLGHIPTAEKRLLALTAIARLLAPQGRLFLDVNHRYNLRSYGILPTCARWMRDLFSPSENNGDVLANWRAAGISTYGHVFTHGEVACLADEAGFDLEERRVIDYEDGRIRRFAFQGNLLYVFRRSSRIDSASAPQTS